MLPTQMSMQHRSKSVAAKGWRTAFHTWNVARVLSGGGGCCSPIQASASKSTSRGGRSHKYAAAAVATRVRCVGATVLSRCRAANRCYAAPPLLCSQAAPVCRALLWLPVSTL